jgi:RNA polymerase sigma-70 factor (ECF subfamily)
LVIVAGRSRHDGNVTRVGRLLLPGAAQAGLAGDARVREWVDAHFDFIWRLLRRLGLRPADADDAAQHVFMIALHKIDAIAPGQERSFLYGTALRVAANVRRAARRKPEAGADALELRAGGEPGPEQQLVLGEACALLDELLERLPDELRRVLVLAEIEQLEMAEIAKLEQIPVGTVASRLRRARVAFRALLQRAGARNPFAGSDS